jgi:hypothetical protein
MVLAESINQSTTNQPTSQHQSIHTHMIPQHPHSFDLQGLSNDNSLSHVVRGALALTSGCMGSVENSTPTLRRSRVGVRGSVRSMLSPFRRSARECVVDVTIELDAI